MTISTTLVAMTISPASFDRDELFERVRSNLDAVRRRIASTGRDLDDIRIVAVTKTFPIDFVRAADQVGLTAVGENYVDELCTKRAEFDEGLVTWHYLGALQTNKIHRIVTCADVICGVSRMKELEKIASYPEAPSLYVQVDFTGSDGRNGADPNEVESLVARARFLGLEVTGLMTVAPPDLEGARKAFAATRGLADDVGLAERSMGMSDDLEIACEQGTTEVRIGRALFGDRDSSRALT